MVLDFCLSFSLKVASWRFYYYLMEVFHKIYRINSVQIQMLEIFKFCLKLHDFEENCMILKKI